MSQPAAHTKMSPPKMWRALWFPLRRARLSKHRRLPDRESARVDALIAGKERLLGLLAEKRQALITRGLDPNAPLRDSGIPWLGRIPSQWRPSD